ncbi:unnamed protein product, partial [Prorocentrum cordatum]
PARAPARRQPPARRRPLWRRVVEAPPEDAPAALGAAAERVLQGGRARRPAALRAARRPAGPGRVAGRVGGRRCRPRRAPDDGCGGPPSFPRARRAHAERAADQHREGALLRVPPARSGARPLRIQGARSEHVPRERLATKVLPQHDQPHLHARRPPGEAGALAAARAALWSGRPSAASGAGGDADQQGSGGGLWQPPPVLPEALRRGGEQERRCMVHGVRLEGTGHASPPPHEVHLGVHHPGRRQYHFALAVSRTCLPTAPECSLLGSLGDVARRSQFTAPLPPAARRPSPLPSPPLHTLSKARAIVSLDRPTWPGRQVAHACALVTVMEPHIN